MCQRYQTHLFCFIKTFVLVMDIQKMFLHRKKKTFNNFFLCKILFSFRSVACSMFLYKLLFETFYKKAPLHRHFSLLQAFSIKLIHMILLLILYKNIITTQTPVVYKILFFIIAQDFHHFRFILFYSIRILSYFGIC